MPIVVTAIPSFPVALLTRATPSLAERPLALLGPDDRVLDATAPAFQSGVQPGHTLHQAHTCCPDLEVRQADLPACQDEFEAILSLLDDFSSRVEPAGLGQAFMDVPDLDEASALPFCQDVGRRMRQAMGLACQPAIGCDSGKFTAHVAAAYTRPGAVRLVLGEAEQPFLRPLLVSWLPLPADSQRRLHYLGIHRLGQYADLPARAVLQQFGVAGRLAHRWAKGQDDRPVIPRQQRPSLTVSTEFEAPLDAVPPLLMAATRLLEQPLTTLNDQLQAVQVFSATRQFTTGGQETDTWRLPSPTAERRRLLQLLADRWQASQWEGAVTGLTLTVGEIQDLWAHQPSLFPNPGDAQSMAHIVKSFQLRYGQGRLLQARLHNPKTLRVEKRAIWQPAAS